MRARTLSVAVAAAALAIPASAQGAERFYAVTKSNRLVSFNSDSPGAIRSAARISGMSDSEHLVGIDRRSSNGVLYGVGTASYLYSVTPAGRATRISPDLFDVFVQGSSFGVDFDPGGAALRLVSNQEQNMRISPSSGRVIDGKPASALLVNPDNNLQFAQEDRFYPEDPNVGGIAYTGAGALYGIDASRDVLVRITDPNDGEVRTVGPLGVKAADPLGFDVASDGVPYAAFRREGKREVELWRVNLSSGRATRAARIPQVGSHPTGRGRDSIMSLAAAGRVANDIKGPRIKLRSGASVPVRKLRQGRAHVIRVRLSEAGRVTVRLFAGRKVVARFGKDYYRAGTKTIRLRLKTKAQRRRARGARSMRFTVNARDAAGNVTRRKKSP